MAKLSQYKEVGAKITPIPKLVNVPGLVEMVDQLSKVVAMQQQLTSQIIDTMAFQGVQSTDIAALTKAIQAIKPSVNVATPEREPEEPYDWEVSFDRDQRGLMKSGIKFSKVHIQ